MTSVSAVELHSEMESFVPGTPEVLRDELPHARDEPHRVRVRLAPLRGHGRADVRLVDVSGVCVHTDTDTVGVSVGRWDGEHEQNAHPTATASS